MKSLLLAMLMTVSLTIGGVAVTATENESTAQSAVTDAGTEALEEQVAALTSENAALKEQVSALEAEKADLQSQIDTLKAEAEAQSTPEPELSSEIIGTQYTDTATVMLVQQALNDAGYNCGTADGKAGAKTKEAIQNYQKANRINTNGVITDQLLEAMGIADKVSDIAKLEASKAEYSWDYSYTQLARTPDSYIGTKVAFKGKVLQAQRGEISYIRLAINSDFDTVIFITYDKDIIDYNLLEDDQIVIYGSCFGEYSYEAVSGATITLPWIGADIIELK